MKINFFNLFLFFSVLLFVSCSDWLDIEPEGQATNQKLTETGDGYRTMLGGIYKVMTEADLYGRELQFGLVDCVSQQYSWTWANTSTTSSNIYQNAKAFNYYDIDLRTKIDEIWRKGYNAIANTNNLIQNIGNENEDKFAKGESERMVILGEAYACRALMHFDLCRLFAPAPVHNEGGLYLPYVSEHPNTQPQSIDVKEFLKKVIADLLKAQELTAVFDTTALGQSLNVSAGSRFHDRLVYGFEGANHPEDIDDFYKKRGTRLNYYAITALMARVYQYMGEYDKAFEYAQQILNAKAEGHGTEREMFNEDDWYDVGKADQEHELREDLKVESNLIFALYNNRSYEDYDIFDFFQKKSTAPGGNLKWLAIDLEGQDIFKTVRNGNDESKEDARAKYLLFSPDFYAFDTGRYKLSAKWYPSEDKTLRTKNLELLPMIRATELRYIMAETYARNGKFKEAYAILNKIREARRLYDSLPVQNSLDDFLADLIRDAQREWISEGQLFYLYKRLDANVMIKKENRKMTKSEYMWPIPANQSI